MGFLEKVDKFINEKTQMLEGAINNAATSFSNVDLDGMINTAEQKFTELANEATTACKGALNDLNNRVNGQNENIQSTPCYTSSLEPNKEIITETISEVSTPVEDVANAETTSEGVSLAKDTESVKTEGVSLKK